MASALNQTISDHGEPHLVWVRRPDGQPIPQLWRELYFGLNDWQRARILSVHRLSTNEAILSLSELANIYPFSVREAAEPAQAQQAAEPHNLPSATATLFVPHREVHRSQRVKLDTSINQTIVRLVTEGKLQLFELPPDRAEEIGAYCYEKDGYVAYMTARSGDGGRDIVAFRPGHHSEKVIVSVKCHKPTRPVGYDEIRSLMGVLSGEQDASRGVLLTTSCFPPNVFSDPFIEPFLPTRLQFVDGVEFTRWVRRLSNV